MIVCGADYYLQVCEEPDGAVGVVSALQLGARHRVSTRVRSSPGVLFVCRGLFLTVEV